MVNYFDLTKTLKPQVCMTESFFSFSHSHVSSYQLLSARSKLYPLGIQGKRVLDLGCGSGRDCYIAAALVGTSGQVTGIDMTDDQLKVACENLPVYAQAIGYTPNVRFVTGYIEALAAAGIEKNSIDICISNCVINLSPDKKMVLEGVYEALVAGGELHFADVYASARLPESVRTHQVLFGECIGGALSTEDFLNITKRIGFTLPLKLQSSAVDINDPELLSLVGQTTFQSITYRLFKLPSITKSPINDRQRTATYNGGIVGCESDYTLDQVGKRLVFHVKGYLLESIRLLML
ncbi:hypothetical protein K450DRAFT_263459 [Umbelopsis ramanniana AG]|uniref:Arsenite methyltransferase n=1 Tax=Umbelopsis ramanniana AG TaxID=1314678 RepID=A0AAD5E232_UMBRA|nr:uncharacterized protein K450DRAFT_263459 [Umbelopsis ramanniana AG]KAI8575066.1 hypothetical protein K450DRAFT_263459 [Umbelopsis ramanniana AG]